MSDRMYRNQIVQLAKEKAALEQRKSDEAKKLAKLQAEIGTLTRGITKHTSDSMRASKLRQIENKTTEASRVQERYARYEGEIARKLNSLKTAQENLDRAVAQTQRQQQAAIKKQRNDQLAHERELTREQQRRARLFSPTISPHRVEMLPSKLKVLFIAANPKDRNLRLWLDEEVHDIKNKIRQARYRDYVDFTSEWAVRTTEVFQALNEHQPNVVHFSGHGSSANELILLDQEGNPKPVTKNAFKQMIAAAGDHIRLVILNTCHSRDLAEAAVEHVDAAIGMNTSIGDEAARVFAAQFHSAVGFGFSVRRAFDQAVAQLMMEGIPEEKTPELLIRPGLNADEIVLVRPMPGR